MQVLLNIHSGTVLSCVTVCSIVLCNVIAVCQWLNRDGTVLLWSPYGIGQTIIFSSFRFFLFFFYLFPRLISAVADWMSAILPHMVWP